MSFFRIERNAEGKASYLYIGQLKLKVASKRLRSKSPSMNIDGTAMFGSVDIKGNPFGVSTTTHHHF